jgi:hypothetical protein
VPEQLHDAALLALDAEASHLELTGHSEAAQPLRADINSLLAGSGRIGPMQRELLLANELSQLQQEALLASRAGNWSRAEQMLEAAGHRADTVAARYPDGSFGRRKWSGTGGLLRAQAALMRAMNLMSLYAFDQIPEGGAAAAKHAANLLADIAEPNSAAATFYSQVLTVVERLAVVMLQVLRLSFTTHEAKFQELRRNIADARKTIPKATGMESDAMYVYCDRLDLWLSNLQGLAKPSPKDRNMLRGFVACATFFLVLAVAEILSKAFGLHASATVVFSASTTLAVLVGFGVPGLVALRGGTSKADGDG